MEYEEKWFVAVTIFLIFFLSNSSVDFAESDHHTLPCYTVKGEIIDKETDRIAKVAEVPLDNIEEDFYVIKQPIVDKNDFTVMTFGKGGDLKYFIHIENGIVKEYGTIIAHGLVGTKSFEMFT